MVLVSRAGQKLNWPSTCKSTNDHITVTLSQLNKPRSPLFGMVKAKTGEIDTDIHLVEVNPKKSIAKVRGKYAYI